MADKEFIGRLSEQAITMLDRVVQFRWALLVVSFMLAADTALSIFWHQSILTFDMGTASGGRGLGASIPTGNYVAFAAVYVFFMAGVSPFFQHCVGWFLSEFKSSALGYWLRIPDAYGSMKPRERYYYKMVRRTDAETVALAEKDSFWIARISVISAEAKKEQSDNEMLAQMSFACTFLLIGNYLAAHHNMSGVIGGWLAGMVGFDRIMSDVFAFISLILLCAPWWLSTCQRHDPYEWIEHPELARLRLEEWDERERKQRESQTIG
ncbi:hypothetical protein HSX11_27290 [Oxalobacteraceae bacterium]|nr:hypothetical protein [Oxalobacteraceae bacterium]